jgi:hypothetical protein
MKSIKIAAIFSLLSVAGIGVLWISDVIDQVTSVSVLSKTLSIILLLGLCFQVIAVITKKTPEQNSDKSNQTGPKF